MNGNEKLNKELDALNQRMLELTEGFVEQRYHILDVSEHNLINIHTEQIRNIGIVSGVVAPFSLTLLQIESIVVNAHILLSGFSVLIVNIAISQVILHIELSKKNKDITDASVGLNFVANSRENLENGISTSSGEIKFHDLYIRNLREVDKKLGISKNNTESLMTKIRFRKYDKFIVYTFTLGCFLILLSLFFSPLAELVNTTQQKLSDW